MKKLNPEHIEVMKEIISQAPFMKLLGMQVRTLDYGMCHLELTMERKHLPGLWRNPWWRLRVYY